MNRFINIVVCNHNISKRMITIKLLIIVIISIITIIIIIISMIIILNYQTLACGAGK